MLCFRFIPPPHIRHRLAIPFTVVLKIGRHEFRGQGATRQLARHNAASRALKVLKNVKFQRKQPTDNESSETSTSATTAPESKEEEENTTGTMRALNIVLF